MHVQHMHVKLFTGDHAQKTWDKSTVSSFCPNITDGIWLSFSQKSELQGKNTKQPSGKIRGQLLSYVLGLQTCSPADCYVNQGIILNSERSGDNGDGDDDGDDYYGRRYNSTRRYRELIMIIYSNSKIISPIKSTYVGPSVDFKENEYCWSDCQQQSDSH